MDQADSGRVLYNAGVFFLRRDPVRAVHLLEQSRQLDPGNRGALRAESSVYTRTYTKPTPNPSLNLTAEQVQTLQSELASATDPALLAEVGSDLIRLGQQSSDGSLKAKGTALIDRAISLDPNNDRWKTAAERAANVPALPPPPPPPAGGMDAPSGPVRVGGQVAEANLIRKVNPVYPDTARAARISGTVEFTATISEAGHIENLQLVRGHPLLVNAAKEAVLQYQYKPTLLNGNPVRVVTSITVPFESPSQ